jgi:hypothetical protein
MLGVYREVAKHMLNIKPSSKPVKQGLRRFDQEKHRAMGEELSRLLAASCMEVQNLDWSQSSPRNQKEQGVANVCRLHEPHRWV